MKLYVLQCDGCRVVSYNGYPIGTLRRALKSDGWKFKGGKDYCETCVKNMGI